MSPANHQPIQAGDRQISAANYNRMRADVIDQDRLTFDPTVFSRQGRHISLRKTAGRGGILPPWWPRAKKISGGFELSFEPAAINNIVPRVTWADPDSSIAVDGVLNIDDATAGIVQCKVAYDDESSILDSVVISARLDSAGLEADSPGAHFVVLTHVWYTWRAAHEGGGANPNPWKLVIRPVYWQSIQALRCGDFWRWG